MQSASIAALIDGQLADGGDPSRAAHASAYLRSSITHYGTPVPVARGIVKPVARELDHDGLWGVVDALWAEPIHERRLAAALLLEYRRDLLGAADLPRTEVLLRQCRTWALVDVLVPRPMDAIDQRAPAAVTAFVDRWAVDADFWVRRAAVLAHLIGLREGRGDWARFARYADGLLADREFFVRKALGWVLRETSRRRPELVAEWVGPRADRMSAVTFNEAVRHLPADVRPQRPTRGSRRS